MGRHIFRLFIKRNRNDNHRASTSNTSSSKTLQNKQEILLTLPHYLLQTSFPQWIQNQNSESFNQTNIRNNSTSNSNFLPSCWNSKDKGSLLEITRQNLRISYIGAGKGDTDIAALRANASMPPQAGIYYYEVEIISKGRDGYIGIGFCCPGVALNRLPGWEPTSWGYHGDDGHSFSCSGTGKPYGPTFTTGDIIGCGVNFRTKSAFYTKNGIYLGIAFTDLPISKTVVLYPSVGLRTPGEQIEANFGSKSFKFDIEQLVKEEKEHLWSFINNISMSNPVHILNSDTVYPSQDIPDSSSASLNIKIKSRTIEGEACSSADAAIDMTEHTLNLLIIQYLVHHGYSQTAISFYNNSMSTKDSNNPDSSNNDKNDNSAGVSIVDSMVKDLLDSRVEKDIAIRQRIRDFILDGYIEDAINLTNQEYPDVFKRSPDVLFKLKCRQLIEMIAITDWNLVLSKQEDVKIPDSKDDYMDVDDDVPSKADRILQSQKMMNKTIEFGKQLQSEYHLDTRPETLIALRDAFSLLAYPDWTVCSVSYLLNNSEREPVATALNSAILESQGKPSIPSIELIYRQASASTKYISNNNLGDGAFVKIREDCLI